jgi:hypothetical protein
MNVQGIKHPIVHAVHVKGKQVNVVRVAMASENFVTVFGRNPLRINGASQRQCVCYP